MFKVLANRSQLGKVLRYIINALTLFRIHHCKSFSHIYIQDTHSNDNTIHCKIQFGPFELKKYKINCCLKYLMEPKLTFKVNVIHSKSYFRETNCEVN